MDGDTREQLIEAGLRLLQQHRPQAFAGAQGGRRGRRLPPSAVCTHFGGIARLIDAIAGESVRRFARALAEVSRYRSIPWPTLRAIGIAY